jgi:hypothetical protein
MCSHVKIIRKEVVLACFKQNFLKELRISKTPGRIKHVPAETQPYLCGYSSVLI